MDTSRLQKRQLAPGRLYTRRLWTKDFSSKDLDAALPLLTIKGLSTIWITKRRLDGIVACLEVIAGQISGREQRCVLDYHRKIS
jgi:hypothetical protein